MVGIIDRTKAFFREHPVTTERKVNRYLTEHLPRLAREYKLATVKDSTNLDTKLKAHEGTLDELDHWMGLSQERVDMIKKRVNRLEAK